MGYNRQMQAILFAFISYIGWGTGDVFGAIASRKIGGYSTTFWAFFLGLFMFSLYIPFAIGDITHYTFQLLFINLVIGILSLSGNIALNEAMRLGNPSLMGTISSAFTGVTVILSVIFLHDKISFLQVVIIGVIFAGVALSSLDFKTFKNKKSLFNKGVLLALISMLSWGIFFTGTKALSNSVGWFWPQYITFVLCPLVYFYMRKQKIEFKVPQTKKILLMLLLNGFLLRTGDFSFQFALSLGSSAIAAPIAGSYPTLFALLSFFVFREPLTKQQIAGIVITLIGVVLLASFTA